MKFLKAYDVQKLEECLLFLVLDKFQKEHSVFESLPEGTKISMAWDGTSKSPITRIFLRVMQGKIAKQAEAELNTFKTLVEMYGVKFPVKN